MVCTPHSWQFACQVFCSVANQRQEGFGSCLACAFWANRYGSGALLELVHSALVVHQHHTRGKKRKWWNKVIPWNQTRLASSPLLFTTTHTIGPSDPINRLPRDNGKNFRWIPFIPKNQLEFSELLRVKSNGIWNICLVLINHNGPWCCSCSLVANTKCFPFIRFSVFYFLHVSEDEFVCDLRPLP